MDFERTDFYLDFVDKDRIAVEVSERTNIPLYLVRSLIAFHSSKNPGRSTYFENPETEEISSEIPEINLFRIKNMSLPVQNITLNFTLVSSKPKSITKDLKKLVYQYLTISNNLDSEKYDSVTIIKFKIEKTWLENNKIPHDAVVLTRYEDKWVDLPTNATGNDEDFVYFESLTTGYGTILNTGQIFITTVAGTDSSISGTMPCLKRRQSVS